MYQKWMCFILAVQKCIKNRVKSFLEGGPRPHRPPPQVCHWFFFLLAVRRYTSLTCAAVLRKRRYPRGSYSGRNGSVGNGNARPANGAPEGTDDVTGTRELDWRRRRRRRWQLKNNATVVISETPGGADVDRCPGRKRTKEERRSRPRRNVTTVSRTLRTRSAATTQQRSTPQHGRRPRTDAAIFANIAREGTPVYIYITPPPTPRRHGAPPIIIVIAFRAPPPPAGDTGVWFRLAATRVTASGAPRTVDNPKPSE